WPKGFVKIRHYGLLANGQREARLGVCRRLLLVEGVAAVLPSADTLPIEPAQPRCCPECGGTRLGYRALARTPLPAGGAPPPAAGGQLVRPGSAAPRAQVRARLRRCRSQGAPGGLRRSLGGAHAGRASPRLATAGRPADGRGLRARGLPVAKTPR